MVKAIDSAARKQSAETVREKTAKNMGGKLPNGFNVSADGPDATFFVSHAPRITFDICKVVSGGRLRLMLTRGVESVTRRTPSSDRGRG